MKVVSTYFTYSCPGSSVYSGGFFSLFPVLPCLSVTAGVLRLAKCKILKKWR